MKKKRSTPLPAARDSMRIAAVDIGSNSIHMIIAQINADGTIATLWRVKEPVGLGKLSFPSHKLSAEAMRQALGALARMRQAGQQRRVEKTVAVATSAVREAANGGAFIERVRRQVGLHVRVVTAREEARLIYLAVRHAAPLANQRQLILDIGGGSVEFIVGDGKQAVMLESRKLGAARMTARFVESDPINAADRAALAGHYEKELAGVVEEIHRLKPRGTIGTSGTLENLAAMCGTPERIDRAAFGKVFSRLLRSSASGREKMARLDPQRRDQILAGAILVDHVMRRLNVRTIRICRSALREGIVLDYIQRHLPELAIRHEVPEPRRRSVLDLARRCNWNRLHSQHVAMLTLRLFDELETLHDMGGSERELIEYGALLHDIGWHIEQADHHKHALYLIENGRLKDFTAGEIGIIANIARYHRKSPPKTRHLPYQALSARQKRIVDVGAGLLRIADGMDRGHNAVIQNLRCAISEKEVVCFLQARSDAALEVWAASRKDEMFTNAFQKTISFRLDKR